MFAPTVLSRTMVVPVTAKSVGYPFDVFVDFMTLCHLIEQVNMFSMYNILHARSGVAGT